jgi:hypothetical protein
MKFLFWALNLAVFSNAWGLDLDTVRLLDVSSSEQSITVDRGEFDHYKAHDNAKFYIQLGNKDFPKIYLVAEGELVKSFPRKSYWFLKKIKIPNLIRPQTHLLMMSTNMVMEGRKRNVLKRHVVFSGDAYEGVDQYLEQNKKNIPDHLILEEANYSNSGELFEKETPRDTELIVESYEKYRIKPILEQKNQSSNMEDEELYFVGNKRVELTEILNQDDKKLLDSMSKQYLEKNASIKYGLTNGLYGNQENNADKPMPNKKMTIRSVFDEKKDQEKKRTMYDERVSAKIKRDGINWTDDMDDVALRKYFINTGIAEERIRRERVFNEREGHEFMFYYGGSLSDHSNATDVNYRAFGYDLGLAYDLHLTRANPNLKSLSLQVSIEMGASTYDLGRMNGVSSELKYGAILNYYFINNPLTMNKFIFETGVGLKFGESTMKGYTLSKQYTYQIISVPTFQLLTKYRFQAGDLTEDTVRMGSAFNAGVIFEKKRLRIIDVPTEPINGAISVNDIKFLVGMGFYF